MDRFFNSRFIFLIINKIVISSYKSVNKITVILIVVLLFYGNYSGYEHAVFWPFFFFSFFFYTPESRIMLTVMNPLVLCKF